MKSQSGMWYQSPRGEAGDTRQGWLHKQGAQFLTVIERSFTNMERRIRTNLFRVRLESKV